MHHIPTWNLWEEDSVKGGFTCGLGSAVKMHNGDTERNGGEMADKSL